MFSFSTDGISSESIFFFALRRFHTALSLTKVSFMEGNTWEMFNLRDGLLMSGKGHVALNINLETFTFMFDKSKKLNLPTRFLTCFCCFFSGKRQEILSIRTWKREDLNLAYNYI